MMSRVLSLQISVVPRARRFSFDVIVLRTVTQFIEILQFCGNLTCYRASHCTRHCVLVPLQTILTAVVAWPHAHPPERRTTPLSCVDKISCTFSQLKCLEFHEEWMLVPGVACVLIAMAGVFVFPSLPWMKIIRHGSSGVPTTHLLELWIPVSDRSEIHVLYNYMQLTSAWEPAACAATCKPGMEPEGSLLCLYKSHAPVPILKQINAVHTTPSIVTIINRPASWYS
jgi:hypothetical protein